MSEDVQQIAHETRSSIELSVDAKQVYRWTIKKYHGDSVEEMDTAIEALLHADERLRILFGAEPSEERPDSLPF